MQTSLLRQYCIRKSWRTREYRNNDRNYRLTLKTMEAHVQSLMGENVVVNLGYKDDKCVYLPDNMKQADRLYSTVTAQHENANGRIKHFNLVSQRFRHDISLHGICFDASAILSQLMVENETPLFSM